MPNNIASCSLSARSGATGRLVQAANSPTVGSNPERGHKDLKVRNFGCHNDGELGYIDVVISEHVNKKSRKRTRQLRMNFVRNMKRFTKNLKTLLSKNRLYICNTAHDKKLDDWYGPLDAMHTRCLTVPHGPRDRHRFGQDGEEWHGRSFFSIRTGRHGRKIPESPWGSPIPIGDGDGDVNRFPDGDGDGDGDEAEKRGWGWAAKELEEMAQPVQNINHSAFRSMFEREKLSGNNFNDWFRQLKLVLRVEKKMYVIEQPLPAAPAADSEAQVLSQWNAIYDAYNEVACLILGNEGKPVAAYVLQMKGYVDQVECLGYMLPRDLIVGLILNGLTKDFAGFDLKEARKLKQGALYLYVGNGVRAQVEAIGNDKETVSTSSRRATDLLGIIHTDVCGPLRHVSRQGASYFITFTDDYSRYGYVYLLKHKHELTPPYTPQHKGVFERRNRTLLDIVRSMMNLTTLSLFILGYALESATRILNMVPTKKVDKTPYELWYEKVPNLSYLKGYPKETMGYYIYFPTSHENKIVIARYAKSLRKNLITQEVNGSAWILKKKNFPMMKIHLLLKITSEIPMEVEGFKPPQEEVILVRRSKRTHQATDRLCLNVEAEEHSLGDLNEPTSYKAAMLDYESNKWVDAMNAKIQSMMDDMVWVLVDLPPGCKTVRSKWIFKKKTDMDGIIHTYKARLVAKGYTQLYGVDYEETLLTFAVIRGIRILNYL
ncbi:retrotransposon protein, putative, ty1-copia subclass [Tanacetum coccineum]|uniref:Retrotransposon protein, putative, ty1-copia subclass n=1 Tax=Tanacetum coccineum TaxID=301880 RepID=A0ABQ4XHQ7_9ASTR